MGLFDEWILPIFGAAAVVGTGGAAAPELLSTEGTLANAEGVLATAAPAAETTAAVAAPVAETTAAADTTAAANSGINQIAGPANMGATNMPPAGINQAATSTPNLAQQGINYPNYSGNAIPPEAGGYTQGAPMPGEAGTGYTPQGQWTGEAPAQMGNAVPGRGDLADMAKPEGSALERGFDKFLTFAEKNPIPTAMMASSAANAIFGQQQPKMPQKKKSSLYSLSPNFQGSTDNPQPYKWGYAEGGIAALATGGMDNQSYPQSGFDQSQYNTPSQVPMSSSAFNSGYEQKTNAYSGEPTGYAPGGIIDTNRPQPAYMQNLTVFGQPIMGRMGNANQTKDSRDLNTTTSEFNSPTITPKVYGSDYGNTYDTNAPVSNVPMLNVIQNSLGQKNDAYNLLAQTAPNIAMMAGAPPSSFQAAADATAPGKAQGGIMHFRQGGYTIPGPDIDTGVVTEDDPDFQFTSPYQTTAGQMEKLYKKTHIKQKVPPAAPKLGTIDLTPANARKAAHGGIMGAAPSLGGYAAGGNPRLLKGPGDGMSDNIPAIIGNKQPARLADGEFVIPADVVSHLGNGSTDAGAKHLHDMMDRVRKARTGRQAQGKQINPNKFLPK